LEFAMRVRIINGTYGYHPAGSAKVQPVAAGDEPIDLPDDEAKRLINLGVARAVRPIAGDPELATGDAELTPGNAGQTQGKAKGKSSQNADNGNGQPNLDAETPVL
jgi:hypothetical protein